MININIAGQGTETPPPPMKKITQREKSRKGASWADEPWTR
jgi:hypothetical protein